MQILCCGGSTWFGYRLTRSASKSAGVCWMCESMVGSGGYPLTSQLYAPERKSVVHFRKDSNHCLGIVHKLLDLCCTAFCSSLLFCLLLSIYKKHNTTLRPGMPSACSHGRGCPFTGSFQVRVRHHAQAGVFLGNSSMPLARHPSTWLLLELCSLSWQWQALVTPGLPSGGSRILLFLGMHRADISHASLYCCTAALRAGQRQAVHPAAGCRMGPRASCSVSLQQHSRVLLCWGQRAEGSP